MRDQFLTTLAQGITCLSPAQQSEIINYYRELFEEAACDGKSDADLINELGSVEAIIEALKSEFMPFMTRPEPLLTPSAKRGLMAVEVNPFNCVQATLRDSTIVIKHEPVKAPQVRFFSNYKRQYAYQIEDDTLFIREYRCHNKLALVLTCFILVRLIQKLVGRFRFFPTFEVVLPYGMELEQVNLKARGGNIRLNDVTITHVNLDNRAGVTRLNNVRAESLNLKSHAGRIRINNSTALTYPSLVVNNHAGAIKLMNVDAHQLMVKNRNGVILLNNVTFEEGNLENRTGTIKLIKVKAQGIKIVQKTGRIKGHTLDFTTFNASSKSGVVSLKEISGSSNDYDLDLRLRNGKIKVNGRPFPLEYDLTGKDKKIKTAVLTGTIKLTFRGDY